MRIRLYSHQYPSGSCALLIKAIYDATKLESAIAVAQSLFAGHHPPENPMTLTVTDSNALPALTALCQQVGITIEEGDAAPGSHLAE